MPAAKLATTQRISPAAAPAAALADLPADLPAVPLAFPRAVPLAVPLALLLTAGLALAGCATGQAPTEGAGDQTDPSADLSDPRFVGVPAGAAAIGGPAANGVSPDSLGPWRLGGQIDTCPGAPQMWSLQRTRPARLECWYDYRRNPQPEVLGARPLALKLEAVAGRLIRVSYTLAARDDAVASPALAAGGAGSAAGPARSKVRGQRVGAPQGQPGPLLLGRLSEAWGPSPTRVDGPAGILEAWQWALPARLSGRYQPIAGTVELGMTIAPDPMASPVVDPYRPDPDPTTRSDLAIAPPAGAAAGARSGSGPQIAGFQIAGLQIAGFALGQRLDRCPPQSWSIHEIGHPRAQRICLLSLDQVDQLPVRNLVLNILDDQLAEMTLGPRQTWLQQPSASTGASLERLKALLGPPTPRSHGTWVTWELVTVEGKAGQEVVAFDQANGTLTVGRRLPPLRTATARSSVIKAD